MARTETATVLIADLDDTLLDWLRFWHDPFRTLLDSLVSESGIDEAVLKREFRALHREHRTSEVSFLLDELPSLAERHPNRKPSEIYGRALHSYHSRRSELFKLHEGVRDTLHEVRARGSLIVVFTESRGFYANERIRRLGLDGLVDVLYSPPDHPLPSNFTRYYPDEHYELRHTEHRHLAEDFVKPDPEILREILDECHVDAADAIYVGDNPMKDLRMAADAGVRSVHAAYGQGLGRTEYQLLQDVSHWTDEAIEREREIKRRGDVEGDIELKQSFSELLDQVRFDQYVPAIRAGGRVELDLVVRAWEKTLDVQQHFNDLELRIRNMALTVLTALLGAAAFAVSRDYEDLVFRDLAVPAFAIGLIAGGLAWLGCHIVLERKWSGPVLAVPLVLGGMIGPTLGFRELSIGSFQASLESVVVGVAVVVWCGFYVMDRFWYHRLLYGAVEHGHYVEDRLRVELPEAGLTKSISDHSPIVSDALGIRIRSTHKIDFFYWAILLLLVALAVLLR